ncbi:MAG: NADH-quinone oxidoreductase subunit J [Armatimonadetes bacterium]|nr:NADH-quinone oxidoreductase subunit J [Armatimonadota bacterium]
MPDDISPYAFYPLALLTLVSALLTVRLKNVFHSALFLIVSFFGVAGMYLVLHAEFLSAAQVLVYTGAIAVLILFGIMLTHQVGSPPRAGQFRTMSWIPAVLCLLTAISLGYVLVRSPWIPLRWFP